MQDSRNKGKVQENSFKIEELLTEAGMGEKNLC